MMTKGDPVMCIFTHMWANNGDIGEVEELGETRKFYSNRSYRIKFIHRPYAFWIEEQYLTPLNRAVYDILRSLPK